MNLHKLEVEIAEIKRFIAEHVSVNKDILPFDEAVRYLHVSKSTLYKLTSSKKICFYRPYGSKLIYFRKEELDKWMLKTRESSVDEIKENALTKRKH